MLRRIGPSGCPWSAAPPAESESPAALPNLTPEAGIAQLAPPVALSVIQHVRCFRASGCPGVTRRCSEALLPLVEIEVRVHH